MPFSSLTFIFFFLPVFLLIKFFIDKSKRNGFYLISGFLFYFASAGAYLSLLITSIIVNYLLGLLIDFGLKKKKILSKLFFLLGLSFNLGLLFYFKYYNFFINNINSLFEISPAVKSISPDSFPIGISFFTFLGLSYIIDVYRKTSKINKNILELGLYISFFPKILMGPITLYNSFSPQLNCNAERKTNYYEGIKRFIIGLGKKVLIADSISKLVEPIFNIPANDLTFSLSWIGAISYTLQIYFDFSGYSDMAIGLGKILGFEIPENFNYPYVSKSIKEFWKRWHITLAAWLQIYLFLPIAYLVMRKIKGDRIFFIKTENFAYFTGAFFTMLLCGLWHGANWTFIVWGAYYGIILIVEHGLIGKFLKKRVKKTFRIAYSLLLIIIGWVIFRSESLPYAFEYISAMFGIGTGDGIIYYPELYLNRETIFFIIIGISGSIPLIPTITEKYSKLSLSYKKGFYQKRFNNIYNYSKDLALFLIFLLSIITITASTYNPFIYAGF